MCPGIGTRASWFETALTRLLTMRVDDAVRLTRSVLDRAPEVMIAAGGAASFLERLDCRGDIACAQLPAPPALRALIEPHARIHLPRIERAVPLLVRDGRAGRNQLMQFTGRSQNGGARIAVEGGIECRGGDTDRGQRRLQFDAVGRRGMAEGEHAIAAAALQQLDAAAHEQRGAGD